MRRNNEPRAYGPYKHGDLWRNHYVSRGPGGKRQTDYTTHKTRSAAELELAGARDEAQGTTVRQAVDAYLERVRRRGRADSTVENYEHRLWRLLGLPGNSERPIRWIAYRGEELYQASVFGAGDTHINGLNVGRMFGEFCIKARYLKANPFKDVEPVGRKVKGSTKPRLTVNESRQLEAYCFAHADNPDCVLTYGYLMLGKRASELVRLTVRDLDDDGWLVIIRKAKGEASVGSVAVPGELRDMLLGLARARINLPGTINGGEERKTSTLTLPTSNGLGGPALYLFVNQAGEHMTRFVARDRVKAVLKAAGVTVLPPQALRRTFVDNASRQGFALRSIADMAGQKTIGVTTGNYMSPSVVQSSAVERNLKVLAGGKR